jgi:hypothetical protein
VCLEFAAPSTQPSHLDATLSHPCTLSYPQVTREELDAAATAVAPFGSDNRAGIAGTLHRISALRSRNGNVVGLTCRVGRAVSGHVDMINDILEGALQYEQSVLLLCRSQVDMLWLVVGWVLCIAMMIRRHLDLRHCKNSHGTLTHASTRQPK